MSSTQPWRLLPHQCCGRSGLWTALVLAAGAPLLAALCLTIWHTPFPVTEAVALLEDVSRNSPWRFFRPDTSYYRPLFYATLSGIWNGSASLHVSLGWLKAIQLAAIVALVVALVVHLRPRSLLEAAAAAIAVAVLVGSPGFADNMELPLSYTTIGMPLALCAWMLLNRPRRMWHAPLVVVLLLVALGFKEQGLVIIPLVIAAWWTRAPGATGRLTAVTSSIGVAYIAWRLTGRESWPLFQQAIGLGFQEFGPAEAVSRFGDFPYWIYAYSSAATILEILFAEPTRGVFRIVHATAEWRLQPWHLVQAGSSAAMTCAIAWWGARALRRAGREGWSPESRHVLALIAVVLACGVLSFNYSRPRLGGMAVPFYAAASFFAVREAAGWMLSAARTRAVAAVLALALLGAGWHSRTLVTLEAARAASLSNRTQWLTMLPERRAEFARRPAYLEILESMIGQGTDPKSPSPTNYPEWVALAIGLP